MMAGDAGNFIDPIFSGGTFLAVATGRESARTLDRLLDEPHRASELQETYSNFSKTAARHSDGGYGNRPGRPANGFAVRHAVAASPEHRERRLGAERVLLGTKDPLQHAEVELTKLRTLELDIARWEQITWRNACRLRGEPETLRLTSRH